MGCLFGVVLLVCVWAGWLQAFGFGCLDYGGLVVSDVVLLDCCFGLLYWLVLVWD